MKIGIQTWGSEGDVRPFAALAAALAGRGHHVTLAATRVDGRRDDEALLRAGVRVEHVADDALAQDAGGFAMVASALMKERDLPRQLKLIVERLYEPVAEPMFAASRELCAQNDLVIGHFILDTLRIAAELASRPYVSVATVPMIPSRHVTPPGAPALGEWLNPLWWWVGAKAIDRLFLEGANAFRRKHGARAIGGLMRDANGSRLLNLIAVSPALFPPPPDWPPQHRVCGFFEPPPDPARPLPAAMAQFLADGPAPVYLTFGSMLVVAQPQEMLEETAGILLDTVKRTGLRAIVQAPWDKLGGGPRQDGLLCIDRAPHAEVFPRCAVIVHHAGAGTTQAAVRAGRPSVVVPHATDQAFWAATLHRLGVAPRPVPRQGLRADTLAARVREAHGASAMAQRACELGRAMEGEDGLGAAVRLIEQLDVQ